MASASEFRAVFPEFSDNTKYSDALLTYWLGVATRLVNPTRWGAMTDTGVYLALAHYVSLASGNATRPGQAGMGAVTSSAVDKVSKSVDVNVGAIDGGGLWNATSYGRQYLQMAMIYGAGGVQL